MRRSTRANPVAATVVVFTIAAAFAASERREPSRFDRHVRYLEGAAVSADPRPVEEFGATDELRLGWERFRARYGGNWAIYVDGRTGTPALVSGGGIPWLPEAEASIAGLGDLERIAQGFLKENSSLLGGGLADALELDRRASLKVEDGHWQLVFRQAIDGVRVENSRLDLHVVRGRMVMMGAELLARPAIRGVPVVDARQAHGILEESLGDDASGLVAAGEPELTLIAVDAGRGDGSAWTGPRGAGIRHRLVWRFHLDERNAPRRWVGEVDAHDGLVSAFYEETQYGSLRGGVFPISPDGDCLHGGCEVAGMPMPFADYTEPAQPERYADSFANLACVNPSSSFETNLQGPYVRIADSCGPTSEFGTCSAGADLGMKAGENCSVVPGASPGNTAAARTSYYHVNRVAELARFHDATNTWIRNPVTVNVNVSGTCNANWSGTVINMYGAGGGCANAGENGDILVHEWGHGYDQNDGGGRDKPGEAYADIIAVLLSRDSCMGRGEIATGGTCTGYGDPCLTCTGFREFDWDARQSHTPATPTNWAQVRCSGDTSIFGGPCKKEAHCESYISSEAMYDLAARDLPASGMDQDSAWQLVDRLWYLTRPGSGGDGYTCLPTSNSCLSTSWYQRMRVSDDDDSNLANGTPHAAALFAAFNRHKIACGAAGDANNQNHSSCPALAAPVVTRSVTPAGVQLSWPSVPNAAEYRVYRGELGCKAQQVPIASLTAGQTSYLDNSQDSGVLRRYRVQAFGSNRACASPVSGCIGAPPGSRLQMQSYRVVDDGDGTPEPGETFTLPVSLLNSGADTATAVNGTLKLVSPADARILGPVASWPNIPPTATAESTAPGFQIVVLDTASCGDVLTLSFTGDAGNSDPTVSEIQLPMGNSYRDYTETEIVPIPYFTPSPVQTFWNITDNRTIADLDVTLDIFHQEPTQIVVDLTSPQGTTVRLHNRTAGNGHGIETRFDRDRAPDGPGTMADFAGQSTLGTWTLSVQDLDGSGETTDGYIRPRTLNVKIAGAFGCDPQSCPEPAPTGAPDLRVRLVPDGSQLDLVFTWSPVPGAGYHVLQSTDGSYRSAVDLLGTTTTQTTFTLDDGARTTPALTYFQVRAVNSCHQEGP